MEGHLQPLNEDEKAILEERLQSLRQIEDRMQQDRQRRKILNGWHYAWIVVAALAINSLWREGADSWRIPRGKDYQQNAVGFLTQQFPNKVLQSPPEEQQMAAVAVLFHMIRDGNTEDATRAIEFATRQEFGNASPYVIERMKSNDPGLQAAARAFLRRMAGKDYGPDPAAWTAWWRDPPRTLWWGVTAGERTLHLMILLVSAVGGVLLLIAGWLLKKEVVQVVGGALLLFALLAGIATETGRRYGSIYECQFDGISISYHQSHGLVESLADVPSE